MHWNRDRDKRREIDARYKSERTNKNVEDFIWTMEFAYRKRKLLKGKLVLIHCRALLWIIKKNKKVRNNSATQKGSLCTHEVFSIRCKHKCFDQRKQRAIVTFIQLVLLSIATTYVWFLFNSISEWFFCVLYVWQ